jgi:ABC-type lipoprotein release transport system permease subunit
MNAASATDGPAAPGLGYSSLFVGLRYLLRKKLAFLAMLGVGLSVGTLIVVMSVFTGFHDRLTGAIRGYLSDLTITPITGRLYGLENWENWVEQVREVEHVEGVAPFLHGFALVRIPGVDQMTHMFFRGLDPDLEGDVSGMPDYMRMGTLADLDRTYPDPRNPGGKLLDSAFVGTEFPTVGGPPDRLILITATADLERRLSVFKVNGTFETGYIDYDAKFVVLSLDSAIEFVGSKGAVSGLNVRLDDYRNADEAREALLECLAPGRELRAYESMSARALQVCASTDGRVLAALGESGDVVVWNAVDGVDALERPAGDLAATALGLGPEGNLLLVGHEDGSAVLRDLASGRERAVATATGAGVTAAAISPDGYAGALGRADGSGVVWEIGEEDGPTDLQGLQSPIAALSFDGYSERLAAACAEGTVKVWDAESGRAQLTLSTGKAAQVRSVAFSPDGERILAGDDDGLVVVWDTRAGTGGVPLVTSLGAIQAVAFGTTSDHLLTAGSNGVALWEIRLWAGRAQVYQRWLVGTELAPMSATAFPADPERLFTVGADGVPRLLYCGPRFNIDTWEDQQSTFLEAVAMERFLMALILSLILVVAEFFVFAIVTTVVKERSRDIGILKSIGFTGRQICTAFLLVGLAIGTVGAAIGVVGGLLFADNINAIKDGIEWLTGYNPFPPTIYYFSEIPSRITPLSVLLTAGGAVVCSLIFSLVPALRAARLDPVRTLHYE